MDSKELEKNVISAVFANNELADELIEKTNIEYFMQPKLKEIRKWISKKRANNEEISIVRLATELEVDPDIFSERNLFHEFDDSVELLKKNYIRRNLKHVSNQIDLLAEKKDLTIDDYLHKAQELVFTATSEVDNDETQYLLGDALMMSYENYINRQEGKDDNKIKTGYYQIDDRFGGLKRKHLTVIAADSSVGKTALAISVMRNILFDGGKCAIMSLEMDATEIVDRLVVGEARVPMNDYQQNAHNLSDVQKKSINSAWNTFYNYEEKLFISDKRGMSVEDISAVCRKASKKLGEIDVLVVDYLQNIKLPHNMNKSDELGDVVVQLRALAKQLDVPILLLSQLNRNHNNAGKRPTMNNLRGSGEIGETADEIWLLYRPDREKDKTLDNDRKSKGPRVMGELIQEKGRTSGVGICKMYYYEELTRWEDGWEMDKGMKNKIEILRNN